MCSQQVAGHIILRACPPAATVNVHHHRRRLFGLGQVNIKNLRLVCGVISHIAMVGLGLRCEAGNPEAKSEKGELLFHLFFCWESSFNISSRLRVRRVEEFGSKRVVPCQVS